MWPALRPGSFGSQSRLSRRGVGAPLPAGSRRIPTRCPRRGHPERRDIVRHKPHLAIGPLVVALAVERIASRLEVFPPGGRRGSGVLIRPQADPVLRGPGLIAVIGTLVEVERLLSLFRLQEKRAA